MALNQITFFVLPKKTFTESKFFNSITMDEHASLFDDSLFWEQQPMSSSVFENIGLILKPNKSWNEKILLYGTEDSNRLEVLFDENKNVITVSFRIDFLSNYEPIVRNLIEFFIFNEFVVLDEQLNLLPLNFEAIDSVIKKSPQIDVYNFLAKKPE